MQHFARCSELLRMKRTWFQAAAAYRHTIPSNRTWAATWQARAHTTEHNSIARSQLLNMAAAATHLLQEATGYRLEVATVRRLEFENDTFAFGDKLINKWYGKQKVRGGAAQQRQQHTFDTGPLAALRLPCRLLSALGVAATCGSLHAILHCTTSALVLPAA